LGAGGALAQTAPGDPAGNQTIPEKDLALPEASRPAGTQGETDTHKKNLSDKLDASGGVIKPAPGIDPEIVKPAPGSAAQFDPGHSASWDARRSARSRAKIGSAFRGSRLGIARGHS
jgi:hypothetical protein